MALELKGLKGQAIKAAANIDRLNRAYGAFNEAAPAHAADVEGLTPQIAALQDDLAFAAQVLGNSVSNSGADVGQQVITKLNGEPVVGQQTAMQTGHVVTQADIDRLRTVEVKPHVTEAGQEPSQTFRAAE